MSTLNHFEKFESYIPVDLLTPANLLAATGLVLFIVLFRYFLMVTPFWWLFYKRGAATSRRIYQRLPGKSEQLFEIKWSLISGVVFAVFGVLLGVIWQLGWTRIYLRFDEWGWFYFWILGPALLLILHDTYFYWTHRWLHLPSVYRRFHRVHHESLHPSPWASFSFHPVESAINAAAIPLIVLILPLHPVHLLVHLTLMTVSAITNHLGFEVLPLSAARQGWGAWVVSGLHHAQHHRFFKWNYGLFFSVWDRMMKTEHPSFWTEFLQKLNSKTHVS